MKLSDLLRGLLAFAIAFALLLVASFANADHHGFRRTPFRPFVGPVRVNHHNQNFRFNNNFHHNGFNNFAVVGVPFRYGFSYPAPIVAPAIGYTYPTAPNLGYSYSQSYNYGAPTYSQGYSQSYSLDAGNGYGGAALTLQPQAYILPNGKIVLPDGRIIVDTH